MIAPIIDNMQIFIIFIKGSKIINTIKLLIKDTIKPEKYPIKVFLLPFGKFFFPKRMPKIEAAPSPKVEINAEAENTDIGKKNMGTKDNTKATGLVNSYISFGFKVFTNTLDTVFGIRWYIFLLSKIYDKRTKSSAAKMIIPAYPTVKIKNTAYSSPDIPQKRSAFHILSQIWIAKNHNPIITITGIR